MGKFLPKKLLGIYIDLSLAALPVIGAVGMIMVVLACIGWKQGYTSALSYVLFFFLNVLVLIQGMFCAQRDFKAGELTDALITCVILAFGQIVVVTQVLAIFQAITPLNLILIHGIILGLNLLRWGISDLKRYDRQAVTFVVQTKGTRGQDRHDLQVLLLVLVGVTLSLVLVSGLTRLPTAYDALTYHLVFPAHWIQTGDLSIYPTPFGDQAPAYAPSNGEILSLFWMIPFSGDLFVRIGQFIFAILAAFSLFGMGCKMGWQPKHALFAPLFFLVARPVLDQSIQAYVDLVFSATYLSALYFMLRYGDYGDKSSLWLCGFSLGLSIGSKYAALVFAPTVIFPLLFLIYRRNEKFGSLLWQSVQVILAILICGGYFYLRNLIETGSPVYPASLTLFGYPIFPGAYSRAVMNNSPFHLSINKLGLIMGSAFGWKLFLLILPAGILMCSCKIYWRHERGIKGYFREDYLLFLPFLLLMLYWWGIPYNSEYRFLFPMVALSCLWFAYILENCDKRVRWQLLVARGIEIFYGLIIFWMIVGKTPSIKLFETPITITGKGLIEPEYFIFWSILSLVMVLILWGGKKVPLPPLIQRMGTLALFLICILTGMLYHQHQYPDKACNFFRMPVIHFPSQFFAGWQWILSNVKSAHIAYTGNNLPYYLFGQNDRNRVYYVNINDHLDWMFHDYDLAERKKPDFREPDTPKPAYERKEEDEDAWIRNLYRKETHYLFITTLMEFETAYLWHDAEGFPIEATWAKEHPDIFTLVYENQLVRIYTLGGHR